ncbi:phosphatase 2C-like domain-containing protein [Aspergillus ambiguus]|uniref:PP2C family serine/threonine-protein phosphatase n=1 Tax=Aspergillus ambiguus TaxID=176160 RepID=UPI003CCD01B9
MLLLGAVRTRLTRVATMSMLQRQARHSYSTKRPSSNRMRHIAVASLVITQGLWWFMTTRDDNVPRLESSTEQLVVESSPSPDLVTQIISQGSYTFPVRNVAGVNRYDGAQLASNGPCEDRFTHGKLASLGDKEAPWMAWAVFDGHAGWQTAALLEKQLVPYVRRSLSRIKPPLTAGSVPDKLVQQAVTEAFVSLDASIIETASVTSQSNESLPEKVAKLIPAYSGSCALLSLYDPTSCTLHVACTGDSRAVLGQKRPDGTWEAIPLSVDQTGSNEDEIARLQEEHPGEENLVKDGRWKWPLEFQREMKQRFYGPAPLTPRYDVRTPPYLTAEPVVTSTKIDPRTPSVLVMATDGMWDTLSSQQAIDLVGKWLQVQATGETVGPREATYEPFDFGHFWNGMDWRFTEERTTVQDDNAAVHLVRNSLGGNHRELVAGRLAFSAPFSRNVRDDITVQVVFFNTSGIER